MSLTFIHPHVLWLLLLIPVTAGIALLGTRKAEPRRFFLGLGVRIMILILLIFALAGIQVRRHSNMLTVVFMLDVSDSINAEEQARGEAIITQAVGNMSKNDKSAIVVFGENALIEQLVNDLHTIPDISSIPITTHTDIASAIQLSMALFPDEGAKRLVLLSDGRQNIGQAIDQADLAAAHGIELSYIPLGSSEHGVEVLFSSLETPASVHIHQTFDLKFTINSSGQTGAELRAFADGRLIEHMNVNLNEGDNHFQVPVEANEGGFRRYTAQIVPDQDIHLQNNQASAFTIVHGPPRILIVEGPPISDGKIQNQSFALAEALTAATMEVAVSSASEIPTNLASLSDYDSIILVDVPVTALPAGSMDILQVFVRDLGRGLLMIGGEQSFGAGGFLRTPIEEALPVYMDVRNKEQEANLALVLAVDKSGSMGSCHCDDPDLRQTYTRMESGQPKVDIAKEAIMRAAGALGEQDFLGVVTFDSVAKWALKPQTLIEPNALERAIGGIPAQGQTNLQSGVKAAYDSLQEVDAKQKHIILLTDGWVHETALLEQAQEMHHDGITLSVVAAGGGSAQYLEELANQGGGTYYPAEDIMRVPDFFLKETVTAVGRYIIEEPFIPILTTNSPILSEIDPTTLPPLYGYNGTTPKGTARIDLITPKGDPLLAAWQYGLGRSAVWTSDLENRWATQWLNWDGFPRFSAQLVGWTLPEPQVDGLSVNARVEENIGVIELEAQSPNGEPLNFLFAQATLVGPDLNISETEFQQVGPGRYRSELKLSNPGTYLVRVGVNEGSDSLGQVLLGLILPYSPEYQTPGTDNQFLYQLARITGGGQLVESNQAFIHNLTSVDIAKEIWQPLLLIAILLFPIDIAVRRLKLDRSSLRSIMNKVAGVFPLRKEIENDLTEATEQMEKLFTARNRAQQQQQRDPIEIIHKNLDYGGENPDRKPPSPIEPPGQPDPSTKDTLSRLKEAKRRIRHED